VTCSIFDSVALSETENEIKVVSLLV
jgi:hypothetical protein